jgi:dihydroorotase
MLVKGGTVLDPASGLHGRGDVWIRGDVVFRVGEFELTDVEDRRGPPLLIDASGMLVVPGLIDLHTHVGKADSPLGLPVDSLVEQTGVTTWVSAGDVGAPDWSEFQREVLAPMRSRVFAFLHISNRGLQGFPEPEMLDMADIAVDRAAELVAAHADQLLGIKVREGSAIVGENGIEPLRRAITAAERAGTTARVMCHIGDAPGELSELLDLLRPGDILTHCFSGLGNNIVQEGRLLPAALAAKQRGVVFDVGHGGGSFNFDVAEAAIDQGLVPDTISSDLHRASIDTPGNPRLPWVMSKFLRLGFSLNEVVAMTTSRPAGIIGRVAGLGTLAAGAPADLTLLEQVNERVEFVDTNGNTREGDTHLRPRGVIRGGRLVA